MQAVFASPPLIITTALETNRFSLGMCVCVCAVQRTPHLRLMLTFALPLVARCVARPLIRPEVSPALSKLRVLCICNNKISSLIGIECLTSLEELDVAHNDISSFDELRRLRHLDKLTHLWVDGTLLCFALLRFALVRISIHTVVFSV